MVVKIPTAGQSGDISPQASNMLNINNNVDLGTSKIILTSDKNKKY